MQEDKKKDSKPEVTEIGATGTTIWSGIYNEEYLSSLRGMAGAKVYDKMRRSDGMVSAILLALELPVKTASWNVKQDNDVPEEMTSFLNEALFSRMSISWSSFMHHVMLQMAFGFSLFEKVYKIEDGKVWWKKLAPRMQKSIDRWFLDEKGGISAVQQYISFEGKTSHIKIPIEKLLLFSLNREGSNYEGMSILRPAYKHWLIKDTLYKISGIGLERQACGVPVIKLASGYQASDKTKAEEIVENIRINNNSGIVLPEGYEFEFKEGKIEAEQLLKHIQHHDTMMAKSILAEFIQLGTEGAGGAYALSKDKTDFFMMTLESICNDIADTMNRYAIRELIDYNFNNVKKYPELTFSLGNIDPDKLVNGIDKLVGKKVMIPQDSDEEFMRDLLGLPNIETDRPEADRSLQVQGFNFPSAQGDENKNKVAAREQGKKRLSEFKPSRKLNKFETSVQFAEIDKFFTAKEQELIAKAFEVNIEQIDDLMRQIEKAVDSGKLNELFKITVRKRGIYSQTLKDLMREIAGFGLAQANREAGTDIDELSTQVKTWLNVKSDAIVELQAAKMKTTAMLAALNSINSERTTKGTLYDVRKAIEEQAKRELAGTASITVGESLNIGRNEVLRSGQIAFAQYSAILDDLTCPLCLNLDEKIIDVNNPDFDRFSPPVHSNCRCIWVYILKEEEGVSESWSPPAPSLISNHGHLIT